MTNVTRPFQNAEVAALFSHYPRDIEQRLLQLRQLIFDVASRIPQVGEIEETLRWGQPSYITPQSKSGTTIRIDRVKNKPGHYALLVHCQTPLIDNFRQRYGDEFNYDKNRAIVFSVADQVSADKVSEFIAAALTYHLQRQSEQRQDDSVARPAGVGW